MDTLYSLAVPAWTSTRRPSSPACVGGDAGGKARSAGPHLRHHDRRPAGAGRLAGRAGRHARGHGIDRRVLEADLEPPGGPVRRSCWSTPSTSSRCPGARPTSRTAEWIAQLLQHGLLRASFVPADAAAGVARPDPAAAAVDPGQRPRWPTASRRCWRTPTSSWAPWPPTCWACRAGTCCEAIIAGEDGPGGSWPSWRGAAAARRSRQLRAGPARAGDGAPPLPAAAAAGPPDAPGGADRPAGRRASRR